MYTLQLASNTNNEKFIELSHHFRQAQEKIKNNAEFKKIFEDEKDEFSLDSILPIIIKESMMNNNLTSSSRLIPSSQAVGYGQLMPSAIEAIQKAYPKKDYPLLHALNRYNAVDNLILSYVYHQFVVPTYVSNIIKKSEIKISFSGLQPAELQYFIDFAYNAGTGRLEELLKQSQAKNLSEFKKYCARKI